jgi:hypothetical protein
LLHGWIPGSTEFLGITSDATVSDWSLIGSGGFMIQKADFRELISAIPDGAMVGQIFVHSPRPRPVDASEATRFVEQCHP